MHWGKLVGRYDVASRSPIFANGAVTAAFAAIVSSVATSDEVALDEGGGISGSISDKERVLATKRMEEVLNVAEANGDELTATYARRALGHGLQFDEGMTAAAKVYVGRGEADPNFGRITIGKSFFFRGTNPELTANFPADAAMLSSQPLRVQQIFRLRHEIAHMSYSNRRIMGYGPRAINPQEIDASRQAFDWTKRYIIDAQ